MELMIGCLLKALDPRDASRTQSLKEVSACLRIVLKNFPMTSYNKVGVAPRGAARHTCGHPLPRTPSLSSVAPAVSCVARAALSLAPPRPALARAHGLAPPDGVVGVALPMCALRARASTSVCVRVLALQAVARSRALTA
jgi:hypothetical protein